MKIFILVILCLSLIKMIPKSQQKIDAMTTHDLYANVIVIALYVLAIVFQSMSL